MSKYADQRQANLVEISNLRPYLKINGFVHVKHKWLVHTTCKDCGLDSHKTQAQLLHYDCICKRAEKISATNTTSTKEIKRICKLASVKLLGEYVTMNTPTEVECTKCGRCWSAYFGNLRKGHGCQTCGAEKNKVTVLNRYGVTSISLVPKFAKKRKRTMLQRYGVEYALQNKELFEKNVTTAYGWKSYQLGKRTVHVQGYESQALDWLLAKNVKPSHIVCGRGADIPQIRYTFQGVRGLKYFPDIWIPRLNRLVEVKSDYTLIASLERNLAKRDAAVKAGYDFLFLVMDKNGNRIPNKRVEALISEARGRQKIDRPEKSLRSASQRRA
jgi:hypothetical protein